MAWLIVGFVLINSVSPAQADEAMWWWPFGRDDAAQAANGNDVPPALQHSTLPPVNSQSATTKPLPQPTPSAETGWAIPKPSWPTLELPEVSLPRPGFLSRDSEKPRSKNRWYQGARETSTPSTWDKMKGGADRVGQMPRNAWDKTVDVLTPGDSNRKPSRVARREPAKPSLWKRMLGMEEPEPQGPRTVTEWMAQDRIEP